MATQIFHFSNTGISSGQKFYLKDKVSGIFLNNLSINSNFPIVASNLVYNTGNQNISGIKNFYSKPTVSGLKVLVEGDTLGSSTQIVNLPTGIFDTLIVNGTGFLNNIDLSDIDTVYVSGADISAVFSGEKIFKVTSTGVLTNLPLNIGISNQNSGANTNFVINQYGNSIGTTTADSSIINGKLNLINPKSGYRNNIYGGFNNQISSGSDNLVLGGSNNQIYSSNTVLIGGGLNYSSGITQQLLTHFGYAVGNYCSLIGGTQNALMGGEHNLILGGNINTIYKSSTTGINTIINSWASTIGSSGKTNLIAGGAYNASSGDYLTIINGHTNTNYGRYNNIFNGYINYISGSYSNILNGKNNRIESDDSTVLHGSENNIYQNNGIVIGNKNYIDHSGAVIISDSTSRAKSSQAENSLSLDFINGVFIENEASIYNLRLRNRKFTEYSYKTNNFIFSSYMNIVNSPSRIDAILPSVENSRNFFVKNINSGELNITSTDLIDGKSSITLYKNESAEFLGIIRNGYIGWLVIGGNQGVN